MKNFEKYTTPEERLEGYGMFCAGNECTSCRLLALRDPYGGCVLHWLELEADEEKKKDESTPMPCPFCGEQAYVDSYMSALGCMMYSIECSACRYRSDSRRSSKEVIAAHNRICRAVAEYNKEAPNE